jgi:hypothetical protein
MIRKRLLFYFSIFLLSGNCFSQSIVKVPSIFTSTRIINAQSTETLPKKTLDIRISHRFGDIAGKTGGHETFYGLDNATDIRIGLEYGITDDLMIGLGRNKGFQLRQIFDGFAKYRILHQRVDNKIPVSFTVVANAAISTMTASLDSSSISFFPDFKHRLTYSIEAIIGRKFCNWFSLAILPTYVHRNYVPFGDENDLFALGFGARIKLAKHYAIVIDYTHPFSKYRKDNSDMFFDPLGIGLEMETGGHVFHINFTNSAAIIPNEYIPYTRKSWLDGEFRLGFTISRKFKV